MGLNKGKKSQRAADQTSLIDDKSEKTAGYCGCCRRKPKSATYTTPEGKRVDSSRSLEAATNLLPLRSKREKAHVMRALQEEMARRQRWKSSRKRAKYQAAGPSGRGQSFFPLPMEEVMDKNEEADRPLDMENSVNLDQKRKEWLKRMQTQQSSPKSASSAPTPEKPSWGDQPETLTIDDRTAKEIASHTLQNMVNKVIEHGTAAAAHVMDMKKPPSEMTPEQLIEFRRRDPKAWDDYVTANSVASFGLAKPTIEDETKAKRQLAKNRDEHGSRRSLKNRPRIHFDDQVDVVNAPIGKDFSPSEKTSFQVVPLK